MTWRWSRAVQPGARRKLGEPLPDHLGSLGRAPRSCWRVPACPQSRGEPVCQGGPCWRLASVLARREAGGWVSAVASPGDVPAGPWGPICPTAAEAAAAVSFLTLEVFMNVSELRAILAELPGEADVVLAIRSRADGRAGEWAPLEARVGWVYVGGDWEGLDPDGYEPGAADVERGLIFGRPAVLRASDA